MVRDGLDWSDLYPRVVGDRQGNQRSISLSYCSLAIVGVFRALTFIFYIFGSAADADDFLIGSGAARGARASRISSSLHARR